MLYNIKDILNGEEQLNKEQLKAVEEISGYIFNNAPPGSGKTFTIQKKIVWMAKEHQINTKNILCITFTNEAAREMKERINQELANVGIENETTISTFHSFAYQIIRRYGKEIGISRFSLIDDNEKNKILKNVIKNNEIENFDYKFLANFIAELKSMGLTKNKILEVLKEQKEKIEYYNIPENLLKSGYTSIDLQQIKDDYNNKVKKVELYFIYESIKQKSNLFDFDDLMIYLKKILEVRKLRKEINAYYKYVMCDEAQDIDLVQKDILKLLTQDNGNLFCIFDEDQSIYGFRNSNPDNILGLIKELPDSKVIFLKENFRSTKKIVNTANNLITNNRDRMSKEIFTNNFEGECVKVCNLQSKEAEAKFVVDEIIKLKEKYNFNYSDFAILYRNNDLNKTVEQTLIKNKIPYKINRNIFFFDRKEIKDILAYLEWIINKSEFHLERIINTPKRGIGEKTLKELKTKAQSTGVDLLSILKNSNNEKIKNFLTMSDIIRNEEEENSISELIDKIIELFEYYKDYEQEELYERQKNIETLKEMFNNLDTIDKNELLQEIKLYANDDNSLDNNDKVSLMTLHSSKGKGFKVVFIICCEEGIIPSYNAFRDEEIEEERRLFYVGITRAKIMCYLTIRNFIVSKKGELIKTKTSSFINELGDDIEIIDNSF